MICAALAKVVARLCCYRYYLANIMIEDQNHFFLIVICGHVFKLEKQSILEPFITNTFSK